MNVWIIERVENGETFLNVFSSRRKYLNAFKKYIRGFRTYFKDYITNISEQETHYIPLSTYKLHIKDYFGKPYHIEMYCYTGEVDSENYQ